MSTVDSCRDEDISHIYTCTHLVNIISSIALNVETEREVHVHPIIDGACVCSDSVGDLREAVFSGGGRSVPHYRVFSFSPLVAPTVEMVLSLDVKIDVDVLCSVQANFIRRTFLGSPACSRDCEEQWGRARQNWSPDTSTRVTRTYHEIVSKAIKRERSKSG